MERPELPPGLEYVRTTDQWDNESVPRGLLRAHHVAAGVWGLLVVNSGQVQFLFEDAPDEVFTVGAGDSMPIPPQRKHRVVLDGPAILAVEFYKIPEQQGAEAGRESTGLTGGD